MFFDELDELEEQQASKASSAACGGLAAAPLGDAGSTRAGGSEATDGASSGDGGDTCVWRSSASQSALHCVPPSQEIERHAHARVLSLQQTRHALTLTIRECIQEDFQRQLLAAQLDADLDAAAAVGQRFGAEAQIPVAKQLGFEASPVGVSLMQASFILHAADAEVAHRSALLRWLLDPAAQLIAPIPAGPARCTFKALTRIWRSNDTMCEIAAHLDNTVRELKENIHLEVRIPWHSQRLFLGDQELFDQVVLSSLVRLNGVVDFKLESRKPQVVQWLAELKKGVRVLKGMPAELMEDTEFLLPAVQMQAAVLAYAPHRVRADRALLMRIVPYSGQVLQFVAPELTADKELVKAAVRQDAWALEFAAPELQADRDIVLAAVQQDGEALQFAAPELQAIPEVVLAATCKDPSVILTVPALLHDRKVVVKAIQQDWRLLARVPEEMRADREVVMAAVKQSGRALQHAMPERQADKSVVLVAVQNHGDALRFAAPPLLRDPEVVLAAVRQSGMALGIAAQEVQVEEIALAAARQDRRAFQYVAPHLRSKVARVLGIAEASEGNPWLETEPRAPQQDQRDEVPPDELPEPRGLARHFGVLNLPETATREEIKKRYHQLALQYHPDKYAGDKEFASDMFQRVRTAFEAICEAFDF